MSAVDYSTAVIGWPLFLAGLALIGVGAFALAWMFRHRFGWDEPEIPAVVQPQNTAIRRAVRPKSNYSRADADTHILRRFSEAVDDAADETAHLTDELLHRVAEKLRGGPVCPICGGPSHPVCPSAPRAECPLTTQEIHIGDEATPAYDTTVRQTDTRELSAVMREVNAR